MANILIASPVIGDAADHEGSSVAATLPLANLKDPAISKVTRFLTPSGAQVTLDLGGSPATVNLAALLGHNASTTGTCQVKAADTEAELDSDPVYDSGELRLRSNIFAPSYEDIGSLEYNHFIHKLDTPVTARWWRFSMADASLDFLDIGRLYLSSAFEPTRNVSYGVEEGVIDPSINRRAASGAEYPNAREPIRFVQFALPMTNKEEAFLDLLPNIDLLRGTTGDVLFVMNYEYLPLIQIRSIYGRIKELGALRNTSFNVYAKVYRIEEIVA